MKISALLLSHLLRPRGKERLVAEKDKQISYLRSLVAELKGERDALLDRLLMRQGFEPVHEKERGAEAADLPKPLTTDPYASWKKEELRRERDEWEGYLNHLAKMAQEDPDAFEEQYQGELARYRAAQVEYQAELG